jgi:hypothetical protein
MINQVCRTYIRVPFKKPPLGFHLIPYHVQYESRDFITKKIDNPTTKKEINRKNYVKEFNPYLKSNVSENLDQNLKDFYDKKYYRR